MNFHLKDCLVLVVVSSMKKAFNFIISCISLQVTVLDLSYLEWKPWQISNANLGVYPVRFEHIIDQSANKVYYDSFSNLKSY